MIDVAKLKIELDEHRGCYEQVEKLTNAAYNQGMDWCKIFDLVFSDEISKKCDLDYYNPDTGYDDDVLAFESALKEKVEELEKLYNALK